MASEPFVTGIASSGKGGTNRGGGALPPGVAVPDDSGTRDVAGTPGWSPSSKMGGMAGRRGEAVAGAWGRSNRSGKRRASSSAILAAGAGGGADTGVGGVVAGEGLLGAGLEAAKTSACARRGRADFGAAALRAADAAVFAGGVGGCATTVGSGRGLAAATGAGAAGFGAIGLAVAVGGFGLDATGGGTFASFEGRAGTVVGGAGGTTSLVAATTAFGAEGVCFCGPFVVEATFPDAGFTTGFF